MKRVLVCGGRTFGIAQDVPGGALAAAMQRDLLKTFLDRALKAGRISTIIHGGAKGADSLADEWAKANGVPVEVFPADWETHGKAAGGIRNRQMLVEGRPDVVLAFAGGVGTANMCAQARKAGVLVVEVKA